MLDLGLCRVPSDKSIQLIGRSHNSKPGRSVRTRLKCKYAEVNLVEEVWDIRQVSKRSVREDLGGHVHASESAFSFLLFSTLRCLFPFLDLTERHERTHRWPAQHLRAASHNDLSSRSLQPGPRPRGVSKENGQSQRAGAMNDP